MNRKLLLRAITGATAGVLACAGSVRASGGVVQSASATPFGYSLSTLAADTAVYNTGVFASNPATPAAPNIPFKVLETDATVNNNAYLYLTVFFSDNSPPKPATFPASIANQATDASYLDSYILTNYNVTAFIVQVDGVNTTLTDSYIVGVNTPALLDGTPGGTEYITDAAVLSPLSSGSHTIGFGGIINGNPVIFGSDAITSVPEPTSMGLLGLAGAALMRRQKRR